MDKGEFFKRSFRVLPGQNGTYVIRLDEFNKFEDSVPPYGFSTLDDMLAFFASENEAMKHQGPQSPDDVPTT